MQRYNRQMRFSPFGEQGQHALSNAKLLILGAGALGSHVAELLARMGAHQITIVDMDIVETSNLHRQALYTEDDALNMVPKVHAIKEHIARINHHVDVQTYYQEITSNNIEDILDEVKPDIVIDGWIILKFVISSMKCVTSIKSLGYMVLLSAIKERFMALISKGHV